MTRARPGKRSAPAARAPAAPLRAPDDAAALERRKRASVAQTLFRVARRLNEHALARVEARTGLALRPAHTALFPHVDLEGTRPSVIARRLGVTKQAVHPLIEELVAMGALERVPDPHDARATLVRFSRVRGRTLLDGLAILGEVERELAEVVGAKRMEELEAGLAALDRWLDEREPGRSGEP